MKENLLKLIEERTSKVLLAVKLLEDKFGSVQFVAAHKNTEQVPKHGFLNRAQTISYNLHGIGCAIDFGDEQINFDFNFADSDHTGFNVWRISEFLSSRKIKYSDLAKLDLSELQTLLDELEAENEIRLVKLNEFSRLYYLKDAPEIRAEQNELKAELALS